MPKLSLLLQKHRANFQWPGSSGFRRSTCSSWWYNPWPVPRWEPLPLQSAAHVEYSCCLRVFYNKHNMVWTLLRKNGQIWGVSNFSTCLKMHSVTAFPLRGLQWQDMGETARGGRVSAARRCTAHLRSLPPAVPCCRRCFGRLCVCVWTIWTDVKHLFAVYFLFCLHQVTNCRGHAAIMQTHANEAMHDGGSRGWSPWCTCFVISIFSNGTWLTREPPCRFSFFQTVSNKTQTLSFPFDVTSLPVWFSQSVRWEPFRIFSPLVINQFLSGLIGVFLHVRYIPHQNSQWLFWASVCVCVSEDGVHILWPLEWGRLEQETVSCFYTSLVNTPKLLDG